jgi:6-pyruvoyltetrahydropterin/6-carboxytetrahydropterin synthase
MKLTISKKFRFEAAHYLPNYKGDCHKLHGHSYILEILVKGQVDEETGMVLDFKELKNTVQFKIIDILDHEDLNKLFPNPTAENILIWIVRRLLPEIPISKARLWETEDSYTEWGNES